MGSNAITLGVACNAAASTLTDVMGLGVQQGLVMTGLVASLLSANLIVCRQGGVAQLPPVAEALHCVPAKQGQGGGAGRRQLSLLTQGACWGPSWSVGASCLSLPSEGLVPVVHQSLRLSIQTTFAAQDAASSIA